MNNGQRSKTAHRSNRKAHNIVQKDFYRLMKSEKNVEKHSEKRKSCELGRNPKMSDLSKRNSKFKPKT